MHMGMRGSSNGLLERVREAGTGVGGVAGGGTCSCPRNGEGRVGRSELLPRARSRWKSRGGSILLDVPRDRIRGKSPPPSQLRPPPFPNTTAD